MAPKHDRSASDQSSHQVARRRQLRAERNRRYYAQHRALHNSSTQPSREQLQPGEQLVDLALTEEETAAVTLTQLGLRVQGVALGQGGTNTQEQAQATEIDEYQQLYQDHRPTHNPSKAQNIAGFFQRFTVQSSTEAESSRQAQQRPLSQFFHTLPARSPSIPYVPLEDDEHSNVSTPSEESQRSVNDNRPESATVEQQNNRNVDTGSANGTGDEETAWQPSDGSAGTEDEENVTQEPPRHSESSDEESAYSFASEHSVHSEEENDTDAEVPAVEYMADKLYQQLIVNFHGCSQGDHDEESRKHLQAAGDNHYGLNQVFNDPDFPSVLGLKEMISAQRLAEEQAPSPRQWEAMFCGLDRRRRFPKNVCLHKEQTQAIGVKVGFDVDSFLGFGSSLAMAKKGIWCQFVPQMRQNIINDVHIETQVYQTDGNPERPDRASSAMLRDVPHFLFGRIHGAHDVTIHVLFPHLTTGQQKFVSLTKEQHTRWMDGVFLPAVHRFYDADYTQHLPGSFQHAYANSKAHQVEGRQIETASYAAQQAVGYHLEPGTLEQIWTDILHTVNTTPGLADFRDPQLFFSAKGTKLEFKTYNSRRTLLDVMQFFESTFENVIDVSFVQLNRFYVDIGKEVCPRVHLLSHEMPHIDDEAQVYLWKKCCLEKYLQWMYDSQPPPLGRGQLYFSQNMLYDASSLTSVTPKRSKQREGGLIYSQLYASVKEIVDATKRFPFSNDGMEEMTLDPEIRRGAYQAAGRNRSSTRIVENAYLASKHRTADALAASRQKSFGIREEHRISWELFLTLRDRLLQEDREELEIELSDCPSYAWPVKTTVYMDFLWRSADKFATGFEVVRAQCRKELVTWEQTKIMAMFLRCLRFVFGGHLLSRESAIWWSRRERHIGEPPRLRVWYGLGFANTLPRHGYCWIEPRIDWDRLQFQSHVTDNVLFGNRVLQGQYVRRGRQLQAFVDITRRLEVALEWLKEHHNVVEIRDRLIWWIVHICLQQFRIDIVQCVKAEVLEQNREEAVQGREPICLEWLEQIMGGPIHRMSGNRCDFKHVPQLGHFLFDFDDGLERLHWEDRPFRKLYHRASIAIAFLGGGSKRAFRQCFWKTLYQYHWVLPYPCANAFMQTTKQGQRMWYSIQVREGVDVQTAEEKDWIWARKGWQPGTPKAFPSWVGWDKDRWQRWIEEHSSIQL
jgi:hypothetical protein